MARKRRMQSIFAERSDSSEASCVCLISQPPLLRDCRRIPRMKILFLHGWQSVPGGMKPTFLKEMAISPQSKTS